MKKEVPDAQQIVLAAEENTQNQQVMANKDGSAFLVTGEDAAIYQVASKDCEGQTILIAQDDQDGEQQ